MAIKVVQKMQKNIGFFKGLCVSVSNMRQSSERARVTDGVSLKIRCPHCFQVFTAFSKEFEDDYPDFQCSVCYGKFWIKARAEDYADREQEIVTTQISKNVDSPDAYVNHLHGGYKHPPRASSSEPVSKDRVVLAYMSSMPKPEILRPEDRLGVELKLCPKCAKEVPIDEPSCTFCGVLFIKMIEGIEASFYLRGLWAKVLRNWHNELAHDSFLQACRKDRDLTYCVSCYGRVLKEDRGNKKATEMIKRVEALTWFFEEAESKKQKSVMNWNWQGMWQKVKKVIYTRGFDALMLTVLLGFLAALLFL